MHILIQNLTNPQNIYTHLMFKKKLILKVIAMTKRFSFCAYTVVSLPFWCHIHHKEEEFVCSSGILGSERVRDTSF